jgi:hypothetical protein
MVVGQFEMTITGNCLQPDREQCVTATVRETNEQPPAKEYDSPLDAGVKYYVEVLAAAGIETYESCEGGPGHAYPEPTIRFHGDHTEGFRALAVALQNGLPVSSLRRIWTVQDLEPVGPTWEIVFYRQCS